MAARSSLLKHGQAIVPMFIGVKMLRTDLCSIPGPFSPGIVAAVIATATVLSLKKGPKKAD